MGHGKMLALKRKLHALKFCSGGEVPYEKEAMELQLGMAIMSLLCCPLIFHAKYRGPLSVLSGVPGSESVD